ncbi:hypothetical protein [uncultured Bacteroides sp.]|jgi:hypothetical protein|uniref:hypothetical protein n=1 Tax=uncultured Bacteroides sp. TaxID=162156 RepID=UPI000821E4C0|nr:hypothetical protein [uncultured Bacteroides sp.]SCI29033.1 Uncharacterised protein [uncultured Bacteroides sp.]
MYNILAAIGLITILAILFFLYLNNIDKKREEEKDNYDLAKYSDKCKNIEKNTSSVDEVHKQIRKVLSDPKERLEAETRRRQYQKELDDLSEERHKEYVIKRTYSYKYESDVFDMFSGTFKAVTVSHYRPYRYLAKEDIITEIQNRYGKEYIVAIDLYNEWIENELIREFNGEVSLGATLQRKANIISSKDMNMDKWMANHHK